MTQQFCRRPGGMAREHAATSARAACAPLARRCSRRRALGLAGAWLVAPWFAPAVARADRSAGPLRLASAYSDGVYHTANLRAFVERFTRQTGVGVTVSSNASLKPMAEILPALSSGEIDFGEVLLSAYAADIPLMGIDALPFVVRDFNEARVLWNITRTELGTQLSRQGIRLLYATPWPPQGLFVREPVRWLHDLQGRRFRVYNEVTRRMAELSGATPVTIAASALTQSIARGDVDAMITSSVTGVDSQSWSRMRYFLDVRAWIPKNAVCMSQAAWSRLDEDQHQALLASAETAEEEGWLLAQRTDAQARQTLVDRGITVALPSQPLRRSLDRMGERTSSEWAARAGVAGAVPLLEFYRRRD